MKKLSLLAVSVAAVLAVAASLPARTRAPEVAGYEMTTYQVAFLRRGPAFTPGETPELKKLQEAHLAHIQEMAATGKLLVAGPFTDDGDLRGMFVFRVDTLDEAKALAAEDPAVKAGRLALEWHPWFAAKNISVRATSAK